MDVIVDVHVRRDQAWWEEHPSRPRAALRTLARAPATDGPAPYLDCERLDCYRVAVEFQTLAMRLVANRRVGTLRDQLDRASVSVVLNIAEGAGRRFARDKANSFTIARGSATECAAVLDLLAARGLLSVGDHRHGRGLLVRIVQMLTRLIAIHASRPRVDVFGRIPEERRRSDDD